MYMAEDILVIFDGRADHSKAFHAVHLLQDIVNRFLANTTSM